MRRCKRFHASRWTYAFTSWRLISVAGILAMGLSAPMAWAHDMWLTPSDFFPRVDTAIAVDLHVGHGGSPGHGHGVETLVRDPQRIVRMVAVGPAGEQPLLGLDGRAPAGYFRPTSAACWTLLYESRTAISELASARFEDYLDEEGLAFVRQARAAAGTDDEPGRELYSRSLKSLVSAEDVACSDDERGLPLELIRRDRGSTLELTLLFEGAPVADRKVDIVRLGGTDHGRAFQTDAYGRVRIPRAAGTWLVTAVHARPAQGAERAQAPWRTYFASLTFAVSAGSDLAPSEGALRGSD